MAKKSKLTHRPFKKAVVKDIEAVSKKKETIEPKQEVGIESEIDDEALLESAMLGVNPMEDAHKLVEHSPRPKPSLVEEDEDRLVMRKLDELVHGETPFDFADTDEYIEAHVSDLDRRIVRELKRGEYSIQAHLDLHGYNKEQARAVVADFIEKSQHRGKRCVLIVHGRGHGSKDNIPVLKNKLASWLTRGAIGRKVLAFTSAKPYDGGTGAVYVLLRVGAR